MRRLRILILDSAATTRFADSLESTLATSKHTPRFTRCRLGHTDAKDLTQVDVVLVTADRSRTAIVKRLLEEDYQAGTPVLVAMETAEPGFVYELLRQGAADFILPPITESNILPRLWRAVEHTEIVETQAHSLRRELGLRQLIGRSPVFTAEIEKIPRVAGCDVTVLVSGETGTGKELCARAVHYLSPRSSKAFVPVNCGAVPVDLIENELFGHEKGAFTGAVASEVGLVREAEGGTLFLDEIDCLPTLAQVKLLRFLQEGEYRPLGSRKNRRADVRVVAASNSDVQRSIAEGRLRQDVYYRLSTIPLQLPPLRDRREDIELLARHFLRKYSSKYDRDFEAFTPRAMRRLQLYDWPGNVRELEHVVQRAIVLAESSSRIRSAGVDLPGGPPSPGEESFREAKARVVARFEEDFVRNLLLAYRGNISRAAQAGQKNRRAFFELIRKHGIDADHYRPSSSH